MPSVERTMRTAYSPACSDRGYSTYCDRRLGGIDRWSMVNPEEVYMRVPDDIRDCVGFLGTRSHDQVMRYRGTAFLVSVQCEEPGLDFRPQYLVTAKHCLERAQGPLFVRLNTKDGSVLCEELKPSLPDTFLRLMYDLVRQDEARWGKRPAEGLGGLDMPDQRASGFAPRSGQGVANRGLHPCQGCTTPHGCLALPFHSGGNHYGRLRRISS
jgi:hypothetical protein